MNTSIRPLAVGWKVNALALNMASVRYRALLPMVALNGADVFNKLFSTGTEAQLDGLDALVIVKSFTPDDMKLAQLARARGIRVVFDLCDNVFVDGYGGRRAGLTIAEIFVEITRHVDVVVATTEPLAEAIRARVQVPVVVISDGIETPEIAREMARVLGDALAGQRIHSHREFRQRIVNVLRRVRREGVRVVPALLSLASRRIRGAVVRRMRPVVVSASSAAGRSEPQDPRTTVRILWFGNHGAEHGRFGITDILEFRQALENLARERGDVELVVISNHRGRFEEHIRPLALPVRYVEWEPDAVESWLTKVSIVIVPNSLDAFSICKSANRTVLALAHAVPVVATATPALAPLTAFIGTGDPLQEFRDVLAHPAAARARAVAGYRQAEQLFGLQAIRAHWLRLLGRLREDPRAAIPARPQPALAVVLHLVQDLDLAIPVLRAARSAGIACEAWCSAQVFGKSPRVLASLQRQEIPYRVLPEGREQLQAFEFPQELSVLLTVAETSLGPHLVPRQLTEAALRSGVFVATLQHGFENVGLTYEDALHAIDKVTIAAQRIYTWGGTHMLHPRASASVRARVRPVGCPKDALVPAADISDLVPAGRPIVGIFENLHWHRYTDQYRGDFLNGVAAVAARFPDVFFLVKPHHAGLWLSHRYDGERPVAGNVLIADPQSPEWEQHTASALLPHLRAVITSPSTVALDAARLRLPVAVVAGDLDLSYYAHLPLLRSAPEQWTAFVAEALDGKKREALADVSARFVERVLVPGDAARRIVDDLVCEIAAHSRRQQSFEHGTDGPAQTVGAGQQPVHAVAQSSPEGELP